MNASRHPDRTPDGHIQLAIAGAAGRMGRALIRLIAQEDSAFRLVAAATQPGDAFMGKDAGALAGVGPLDVPLHGHVEPGCDVLVDFTRPEGCAHWAGWAAEHGVPLVSGTTGLSDRHFTALRAAAQRVPIVWSANMSVGVNLLLQLVHDAAARLGDTWDVEIVESHHRRKIDAPSGTARMILREVCEARGADPDSDTVYGRRGETGERPRGQIGVHALRIGEVVGDHKIVFGDAHEIVALEHRALSRDTFAAGALRAAKWIGNRPPGLYSMRDVLSSAS